jgi:hypothetical protein
MAVRGSRPWFLASHLLAAPKARPLLAGSAAPPPLYNSAMQERWVEKRPVSDKRRLELEVRHAATPGGPFVRVGSVTCRVEDWPAFKEYLLDTDREVVEED